MELLTAAEMREVDRYAIETLGIPGLTLMEAAARGVFESLTDTHRFLAHSTNPAPIAILCGKGNNGGDGLALATLLQATDFGEPRVGLVAEPSSLRGDALTMLQRAEKAGVLIDRIADREEVTAWLATFPPRTLVVDALLGTGIKGPIRGAIAEAIAALVKSGREVFSVDVPSGLDADTGRAGGQAVVAVRTITFSRPKLGLALLDGPDHSGEIVTVDIGIPEGAVKKIGCRWVLLDDDFVQRHLPIRSRYAHKGTQGCLLSIAGGPGMTGAAILAARGALSGGVGLVRAMLDDGIDAFHAAVPEAVRVLPSIESVPAILDASQAVLIGPGTVHAEKVASHLDTILADDIPAVIDADAWNRIAHDDDLRKALRVRPGPTVVTPHAGEAARWLGGSATDIQAARTEALEKLVLETNVCVVLKGAGTLIGHPDGRRAVCLAGNPGLATAGSGDVLSGLIGALLARQLDDFQAACVGVFLHASAADLLGIDAEGFTASNIADAIPRTLHASRTRILERERE